MLSRVSDPLPFTNRDSTDWLTPLRFEISYRDNSDRSIAALIREAICFFWRSVMLAACKYML
jgi:hypothetical protein